MITINDFIKLCGDRYGERSRDLQRATRLESYITHAGFRMWKIVPNTNYIGLDITPFVEATFSESTTFSCILDTIQRLLPFVFSNASSEMNVAWGKDENNDIKFYLYAKNEEVQIDK